jgi:hypothetical protein
MLAHAAFDDDREDAGEIGAGHTVTALYEIVPTTVASTDPLMHVSLRYKAPRKTSRAPAARPCASCPRSTPSRRGSTRWSDCCVRACSQLAADNGTSGMSAAPRTAAAQGRITSA